MGIWPRDIVQRFEDRSLADIVSRETAGESGLVVFKWIGRLSRPRSSVSIFVATVLRSCNFWKRCLLPKPILEVVIMLTGKVLRYFS